MYVADHARKRPCEITIELEPENNIRDIEDWEFLKRYVCMCAKKYFISGKHIHQVEVEQRE